jgi:hypothetical protein
MKKWFCILAVLWSSVACEKGETTTTPDSSGTGGSLARFAIAGDRLYAVNSSKLKIFDLRNTPAARLVDEIYVQSDLRTIYPRDSVTLFLTSRSGAVILDLSEPDKPEPYGIFPSVSSCDPLVADKDHAYLSVATRRQPQYCQRNESALIVINISDLRNPQADTSYVMNSPQGLALSGDTMLLCDEGIKVLDISDVNNISQISQLHNIEAIDIIARNKLVIVSTPAGIYQYVLENGQLGLVSKL